MLFGILPFEGSEARQAKGGKLPIKEQRVRADAGWGPEGREDQDGGERAGGGPRGGGGRVGPGLELG